MTPLLRLGPLGRQLGRASIDPTRPPPGGRLAHRGRPAYPPSPDRARRWRRERLARHLHLAAASMKPNPGRDRPALPPDRALTDPTRLPLGGHPVRRGRQPCPASLDRARRWRRERLAHHVRQAVASMKPRPGRDHPAHQPDRASIDLTKPRLGGHLVRRGRHRRHQAHQLAARPEVFASTIVLSALAADCVRQPEGGSSSRPHPAAPPVRRAHRRRRAAGAYQAGQR